MQSNDLRSTLAHFVTGVTVITTLNRDAKPIGVTANSFNSVSMDPPLILWSIANKAYSSSIFCEADNFAVNILAADQVTLSNSFATQGAEKFEDVSWRKGIGDIPLLDDCVAQLECQNEKQYDGGDHTIIIGRVISSNTAERPALAFHRGGYAAATPMPSKNHTSSTPGEGTDGFSSNFLLYLLARARHQMSSQFYEKLLTSDLTVMEWRVLASLNDDGTCEFRELAERAIMDASSLRELLATMQNEGLIAHGQPNDCVTITTRGKDRVTVLIEVAMRYEHSVLAGISKKDVAILRTSLRRVIKNTGMA